MGIHPKIVKKFICKDICTPVHCSIFNSGQDTESTEVPLGKEGVVPPCRDDGILLSREKRRNAATWNDVDGP